MIPRFVWKYSSGRICQICKAYITDSKFVPTKQEVQDIHFDDEGKVVEIELVKHDLPHGDSTYRWVEKKE